MARKSPSPPFARNGSAAPLVLAAWVTVVLMALVTLLSELGWAKFSLAAGLTGLFAGVAATCALAGSLRLEPAPVRKRRPPRREVDSSSRPH
jgi:hypothetical protein